MRIGVVWIPCSNAYYRAIEPLRAMERRGHDILWPSDREGTADLGRLAGCDVVHVYRRSDDGTWRVLQQLARAGMGITYDNDDDLAAVPRESPAYEQVGGLVGRRLFASSVRCARLADTFTTTTEGLAGRYREAGVRRVEVIANHLAVNPARRRRPHDDFVVGWVAGVDHLADVARIPIARALGRLLAEHPRARVESIGVDLGLEGRYRHDPLVSFAELPARIGGWDVGIAPLADLPCNRARSDIKLKEYGACGVPWLASAVGPYAGLGEAQGGRLVADDGWFDGLDRLVRHDGERARLARDAEAWAAGHTIEAVAGRWERVFLDAAGGAGTVESGSGVRPAPAQIRVGAPSAVRVRPRRRRGMAG